jgi:hypothetical protein
VARWHKGETTVAKLIEEQHLQVAVACATSAERLLAADELGMF